MIRAYEKKQQRMLNLLNVKKIKITFQIKKFAMINIGFNGKIIFIDACKTL